MLSDRGLSFCLSRSGCPVCNVGVLWRNDLTGYGVMGFKLTGSGYPKGRDSYAAELDARLCYAILAPPSDETMCQTRESFRGVRTCSRSSITLPSLVGLLFQPPSGRPKTLSFFVCPFVCRFVRHAFERQRFCARFRHEGVGVEKRF